MKTPIAIGLLILIPVILVWMIKKEGDLTYSEMPERVAGGWPLYLFIVGIGAFFLFVFPHISW